MKKKAMALLLAAGLIGSAAAAEVSFNGTVEARHTGYVYSPVAGTVDEVLVKAGETVTADTVIATLKTTKVYAAEDGVITAVFGQPGDSAETVAEKYGAVMYLEGENTYSISASTSKAYDELENFVVHPGETVYVVARNRTKYKGQGVITAVDGSSYTVLVTEGEFFVGDSMDIMRSADYETTSRIGRGNIARVSPTAVTGTGSIVSFAVQPGEKVQRGQLLFETIDGTYAGLEMTGTEIKAGQDGVIAELNIENGTAVTADSAVASIYPKGDVWVNAAVTEADLSEIAVGQKVKVELDWNEDQGVSYEGTVEMISGLGTVGEESTTYPVYVSFVPDENTRYNMTAVVTTLDGGKKEAEADEEKDAEDAEAAEDVKEAEAGEADEAAPAGQGAPEGEGRFPGGERPEGGARPEGNAENTETND